MAKPYRRKGSRFYWIAPCIQGKQVPRSSGEMDYKLAERKLKILEGKIAANEPITPTTDRDSVAALMDLVLRDYRKKGLASLRNTAGRIRNHINPAIGHLPIRKVISEASETVEEYVLRRQSEIGPDGLLRQVENATINRELEIIIRGFRLGFERGVVSAVPKIELLSEENVREGFFEEHEYAALQRHSDPLLGDIMVLAYHTGWRQETLLSFPRHRVDYKAGVIRLHLKGTKNRKPTVFPLNVFPDLRAMLERRENETQEMQKRRGIEIPWVFHRNGQRVRSIENSWKKARNSAGLPHKLIHDFRRTAVRRLKKLGFPESEIMNMVGFKTRAIFDRYDITVEADILKTADEIAQRLGIIAPQHTLDKQIPGIRQQTPSGQLLPIGIPTMNAPSSCTTLEVGAMTKAIEHGTFEHGYSWGCRCDSCWATNAQRIRSQRRRKVKVLNTTTNDEQYGLFG